jgi:hypothetical protein
MWRHLLGAAECVVSSCVFVVILFFLIIININNIFVFGIIGLITRVCLGPASCPCRFHYLCALALSVPELLMWY